MRTLLTTTALFALMSMGAVAQQTTTNPELLTRGYQLVDTDGLASKLLGFPVYSSTTGDAEQIGEINDIVIGESGEVSAVVLGVGGFLGMGEKNVAVSYSDLTWTIADDNTERLVLGVSREQLEAAIPVEMVDDQPMDTAATRTAPVAPGDATMAPDAMDADAVDTAEAPVTENAADDRLETGAIGNQPAPLPGDPNTSVGTLDRDQLVDLDETTLTAEELTGTNVFGPNDEHIGTIGDFVLGEDGKAIDAVIIDFGGFLGIGTKEVAVAFEDLDFYADQYGNNRYLMLNVTREQMDEAPAFNRDNYAQERDTQRIVVAGATDTAAN